MTTKKLLELRKEISKRRPKFVMQDQHKRPDLQPRWRRPKGMHSKMRHGVWGRPASVKAGYRGPCATRGLHASGLVPVLIHNHAELTKIDTKTQGAILAHIGIRKKIELLNACKQKGITLLNVKNAEEAIKMLSDKLLARKESKKKTAKTKTPEAAQEKKEEPKTKEQERKETEKVLTKRET